jgi:hypothetical protein
MSAPPTADELLAMMRKMLTDDPQQNAVIFLGTEEEDMVIPCIEHPMQVLMMINEAVLRGALPHPHWIAVVSDTYALAVPEEEMPKMRPGLLGELFEAGDPRVREAILATCLAPDGPTYTKQQTYTKTIDGIVWGEVIDLPTQDMAGTIANGMRRVLGMQPVMVS